MTKRDYTGLAKIIKFRLELTESANASYEKGYQFGVRNLALDMADYLEKENPRGFDRILFLQNCNIRRQDNGTT